MSAPMEVLFTSDISGQLWNTCVWDLNSGSSLTSYKGESTSHRGLCILGNQYLLGAAQSKPIIRVWALQRREQHQLKIVCPGRVTSLVVSPDSSYCVAAIAEKIHVWQVCSGNLLAVTSRHYQAVNVIRFTDNGSHFISGGEDNLVMVWSFQSVLSYLHNPSRKPEPVHIWSGHSLPVTDLHVGKGGNRARVVSSSQDQTCKIWDLVSGSLLQTIVFPTSVLSVAMDTAEFRLFAGASSGDIYCVNMYGKPIRSERHIDSGVQDNVTCLKGHSKQVTCLSVSLDGTKLASGSHDATVRLWDVFSGQCIRNLPHKGQVTNVLIVATPPAINTPQFKPWLQLQPFKRTLVTETMGDNPDGADRLRLVINRPQEEESPLLHFPDLGSGVTETLPGDGGEGNLKEQVLHLKNVNKKLYQYAVNELLQNKKPD